MRELVDRVLGWATPSVRLPSTERAASDGDIRRASDNRRLADAWQDALERRVDVVGDYLEDLGDALVFDDDRARAEH